MITFSAAFEFSTNQTAARHTVIHCEEMAAKAGFTYYQWNRFLERSNR
jgi:hypothetical protein